MEDRRKQNTGNSFFILQLLAIIRRYRMEHIKASSQKVCPCTICTEAEKLINEPNAKSKWGFS